METKIYKVVRIEGEYAYIEHDGTELLIAMALLPMGVDEGDEVIEENMTFTLR